MQKGERIGNRYETLSTHSIIYDCKNVEILVDNEDLPMLLEHTWHTFKTSDGLQYARTNTHNATGKYSCVQMHRLILNPPAHLHIDHKNGNGLDNRRTNIRIATRSENLSNSCCRLKKYKGVHYISDVRGKKWKAMIGKNKKHIYLGHFSSAERAALAYNDAARQLFGEFARTNDLSEFDEDELRKPDITRIVRKDSKSGVLGVSKIRNKWVARLKHKGQIVLYCLCDTIEEAIAARKRAEEEYIK